MSMILVAVAAFIAGASAGLCAGIAVGWRKAWAKITDGQIESGGAFRRVHEHRCQPPHSHWSSIDAEYGQPLKFYITDNDAVYDDDIWVCGGCNLTFVAKGGYWTIQDGDDLPLLEAGHHRVIAHHPPNLPRYQPVNPS